MSRALWALGYYLRDLTLPDPGYIRLTIRRFRCCRCRRTVSVLPSFAQPYRVVQNITIEKFAAGQFDAAIMKWNELLRRYWARYVTWLPELRRVVWDKSYQGPPEDEATEWWNIFVSRHGDFAIGAGLAA